MESVWLAAQSAAQEVAAANIAAQQTALAEQRAAFELAQAEAVRQAEAVQARAATLEESLAMARTQLAEQAAQLERQQHDLRSREKELASARESLATLVQERDAERRRHDEQLQSHFAERERVQERAAATERRQMEEIDRARQLGKDSQKALAEAERRLEAHRSESDQLRQSLGGQIQEANLQVASLRERLAGAEIRAKDLQSQLQAAQTVFTLAAGASGSRKRPAKKRASQPG
jgi:chromosome segregation ATPase